MSKIPRLTVGHMKQMLERFEDDAELRICPKETCSTGLPEWLNAWVLRDVDRDIVIIELMEEQ